MRLPLFAYDLVLFPGIPLPLRFFEARYRSMAEDVVGGSGEFGVVLARPGSVFEEEIPSEVGTVARVADYAHLPDGQWLVQTVGDRRFRISCVGTRAPYLTADVDALDESAGSDLRADALRDAAVGKLRRLFALRTEAGSQYFPVAIDLDRDPGRASYQIAAVMGIDNAIKQRLLEVPCDDDRLAAEVVLLDAATDAVERELIGG
jgi:Lon protease-like protein